MGLGSSVGVRAWHGRDVDRLRASGSRVACILAYKMLSLHINKAELFWNRDCSTIGITIVQARSFWDDETGSVVMQQTVGFLLV